MFALSGFWNKVMPEIQETCNVLINSFLHSNAVSAGKKNAIIMNDCNLKMTGFLDCFLAAVGQDFEDSLLHLLSIFLIIRYQYDRFFELGLEVKYFIYR